MKIYLTILILLFISGCQTVDLYVGTGLAYKTDDGDGKVQSGSLTDGKLHYTLTHFEDSSRSPWPRDKYIESRLRIPEHTVFSVEYRVLETKPFYGFKFFFNMGLAYVDRLSRVNSSHVLFKEALGAEYKEVWRFFFGHGSNAGIVPPNVGNDSVQISYNIKF